MMNGIMQNDNVKTGAVAGLGALVLSRSVSVAVMMALWAGASGAIAKRVL